MKTIQLSSQVGHDGMLSLQLPDEMNGQYLEILVVMQPVKKPAATQKGWPPGFIDRTYGAMVHDPIERPPQGICPKYFDKFVGCLPDFPEIENEGNYEKREALL